MKAKKKNIGKGRIRRDRTWPPIHLLHSINQYCVMKKRDLFAMNKMDLKFNKIVIFVLSEVNF